MKKCNFHFVFSFLLAVDRLMSTNNLIFTIFECPIKKSLLSVLSQKSFTYIGNFPFFNVAIKCSTNSIAHSLLYTLNKK